ncbi:MAG: Gfo/Idh/MocA family oxidoreductase [Opitutaceae bacterium]|nr:Gfo/Idh/MocA family oxidoreductase [Opitutaceae bacterium]
MNTPTESGLSRRRFIGSAVVAAAVSSFGSLPALGADATPPVTRKIKLGVIGNGGRGGWIAKLFQAHGGYDIWAVADYFQEVADKCGDELGVDRSRRFSTLSGYKRLIESGVEAVAVETPPYFIPEHVSAAVEAGLHVYMAKPVAADVPGALKIEAAGARATRDRRCFLVDYQMPTDPINIEVARRIRQGGLGRIARVVTTGHCSPQLDPPKTQNLESRLRDLIWVNDVAMGCDYIGNFDIHAIDAALWVLGQSPIAATGGSRICRPDPHGDSRDVCAVIYEYADGLIHQHAGQALKNNSTNELSAAVHGTEANAFLTYWGKSFVRGGSSHFGGGAVENLYSAGAERNIARFHREITTGVFENDTCRRAVDGVLTCILGYEAAARCTRLTLDALLKENKRMEVDLQGLKS